MSTYNQLFCSEPQFEVTGIQDQYCLINDESTGWSQVGTLQAEYDLIRCVLFCCFILSNTKPHQNDLSASIFAVSDVLTLTCLNLAQSILILLLTTI